ncbi:PD-(D/E)XK nuclease family protein [bacterium]|nr:MAG: PD-(D/E)XK nuclease family protein [bacterium]
MQSYLSTPASQARGSSSIFKVSRTKLELFLDCKKCFYLECKHGVRRPNSYSLALNNAVDKLLKKEFNLYRDAQKPHPLLLKYGLGRIVPLAHPSLLKWQNRYEGIQYAVPNTNIVLFGALDDVWIDVNSKELIVVDYKATSQDGAISFGGQWQAMYERQLEVYRWLLRKNGHEVSEVSYFLYANAKNDADFFNNQLNFDLSLVPHCVQGDSGWIEGVVMNIFECLKSNIIPAACDGCQYCGYFSGRDQLVEGL